MRATIRVEEAHAMRPSGRRSRDGRASPAPWNEHVIRVRYAETDAQGIVYSAHYLVWFEIGRTEWCRQGGINYRQLEEAGYLLVVTKATCRYLAPARYDDEVVIRTSAAGVTRRAMRFCYEIRHPAGNTLLAVGETTHLWVNRKGKPTSLPNAQFRPFESAPE
jgi:acyl-CoA thioester hydrolase